MLTTKLPERPVSAKGGRPATNQREVVAGIFWILDNGASWKDLPAEFGSKSCGSSQLCAVGEDGGI